MPAYTLTQKELFTEYKTSESGLSEPEITKRQAVGFNELEREKQASALKIFIRQFRSIILYILIGTAILSAYYKDIAGAFVIGIIIIFLTVLGFLMEYKATKDMQALAKLSPNVARVKRKGNVVTIPTREIVPGDILLFEEGDIIAADVRLFESFDLKINESTFTGESITVQKEAKVLKGQKELVDQINMVFATTHVVSGRGMGVVVHTGSQTQIGKIGVLLNSVKKRDSPLTKRLDKLGTQISVAVIILSLIVFVIEIFRGEPLSGALVLVVALAVSGIPESLPIVTTIALGNGMKHMAKEHVLVRRLPAVETLGTCTTICTDKTGTLTQNDMRVVSLYTDMKVPAKKAGILLEVAYVCNNATKTTGDPTEIALKKIGKSSKVKKKELAFDSNRKMMSVHTKDNYVFSKGSPEHILEKCTKIKYKNKVITLSKVHKTRIEKQLYEYASNGYRVLGFAYKKSTSFTESSLIFCGLVALQDPPKEGVFESIQACKDAGISLIMITGDNPITAKAIGKQLGVCTEHDTVLTGNDLDTISDEQLKGYIPTLRIVARATPSHKIRIISALQEAGHIVAMTGDGVNDGPALKKADIGVAMGKRGTQVAREASEIILTDDNFASIVTAVKEGRTIFTNIRKFVYYLLSISFAQVFFVFIAVLFEFNLPLTALMILFTNLLTSDISAIALTYQKFAKGVMHRPPRDPNEGIVNESLWMNAILAILIISGLTFVLFEWIIDNELIYVQSFVFTFLTIISLLHSYNAQSFYHSLFKYNNWYLHIGNLFSVLVLLVVLYIPFFSNFMGTTGLALTDWLLIVVFAPLVILAFEFIKMIVRNEHKQRKVEFVTRR